MGTATLTLSSDPRVMGGALCLGATRIPVGVVVALLEAGTSVDQVVKEFKDAFSVEDVRMVGRMITAVEEGQKRE